jgi:hypothetical protein
VRGYWRYNEMLVIPVDKVVDPKRIIGKTWRADEEERHMGLLPPPPKKKEIKKETEKETSRTMMTAIRGPSRIQ